MKIKAAIAASAAIVVLFAVLLAALGFARDAAALNYERNDVKGREVAFVMMRTPVKGLPGAVGVRGTARRHTRFLYYGTSLVLGYVLDHRPLVMVSGAVGGETANTDFARFRGYGEAGVSAFWAAGEDPLRELLAFHVEGGMRWTIRNWTRPHQHLFVGLRVFSNFSRVGFAAISGVNFTFD